MTEQLRRRPPAWRWPRARVPEVAAGLPDSRVKAVSRRLCTTPLMARHATSSTAAVASQGAARAHIALHT